MVHFRKAGLTQYGDARWKFCLVQLNFVKRYGYDFHLNEAKREQFSARAVMTLSSRMPIARLF